ncbi:MAG: LysR family transcriptional regulator [Tagaea sp.]
MTLREINAFVAFADCGSVGGAAAKLNITQSAVSRRLGNFEARIGGAALFDRTVKPAKLTTAGAAVLARCRRVLEALAALEASSQRSADPAGPFKIGVAHGLGEFVLFDPLDAVRRAFPRLSLRVRAGWSRDLIELVRKGRLDGAVALLTDAHGPAQGETRFPLGEAEMVVVAGRGAGFRPAGRPRLAELADRDWFLNPEGCGCREALARACAAAGRPLRVAAELFGEDLQLATIARGGGLGLVMRRHFEHSPHRRRLVALTVADFRLAARLTFATKDETGRFASVVERLVGALRAPRAPRGHHEKNA